MSARYPQGVPCAAGCGLLAAAGHIYCRPASESAAGDRDGDLDIDVLTLRDRLADGGRLTRRLSRYGKAFCRLCDSPALPGRLYCSDACRTRARRGDGAVVELDGVVARPLQHASRLGLAPSTLYRRLQLGMSLEVALKKPIDQEMKRRRFLAEKKEKAHGEAVRAGGGLCPTG